MRRVIDKRHLFIKFDVCVTFADTFIWKRVHSSCGEMASTFHVLDYVVFGISLLIPLGIGVYFRFRESAKQTTSGEWSVTSRRRPWNVILTSNICYAGENLYVNDVTATSLRMRRTNATMTSDKPHTYFHCDVTHVTKTMSCRHISGPKRTGRRSTLWMTLFSRQPVVRRSMQCPLKPLD